MPKTVSITHVDERNVHISSEGNILLMIQAIYAFVKNDRTPAFFVMASFYMHSRALLDELHVPHLKRSSEKFSTFVLSFDTKIPKTKIFYHSIMSLFISTMHSFDYNGQDKRKEWYEKSEMWLQRLC